MTVLILGPHRGTFNEYHKNVFMEKLEKYQFWLVFYRYTHYYIKVVLYIQLDAFSIKQLA